MKINFFVRYIAIFLFILFFPLSSNAEFSNKIPMTTLVSSKQYGISLPYTDEQCYITITNLKFDEPQKDFLRLRGTFRIDRDLSDKQVFIHDFNNTSSYDTPVYIENKPGKSWEAGEYRNFTTFVHIGEKTTKFEFLVKDSIQYSYQCEYNAEYEYLDFQGGPSTEEFVESDLEALNVQNPPEFAVNTNYPFPIRADVLTPGPDDIILTKPLKIQIKIYADVAGKECLVAKKDLPSLDGYLPKNRRMGLYAFWDYKDMNGKPVPLNKFYKVSYVVEPFEYRLANSDEILKNPGFPPRGSLRLPALLYYFSDK